MSAIIEISELCHINLTIYIRRRNVTRLLAMEQAAERNILDTNAVKCMLTIRTLRNRQMQKNQVIISHFNECLYAALCWPDVETFVQ